MRVGLGTEQHVEVHMSDWVWLIGWALSFVTGCYVGSAWQFNRFGAAINACVKEHEKLKERLAQAVKESK